MMINCKIITGFKVYAKKEKKKIKGHFKNPVNNS